MAVRAEVACGGPLGDFLLGVQLALLDNEPNVDKRLPEPASIAGLSEAAKAECEALLRLVAPARSGDLGALLKDDWLEPLQESLDRALVDDALSLGGLDRVQGNLAAAWSKWAKAAPSDCAAQRALAALLLGVAALQLYHRVNFTGPAVPSEGSEDLPFDPSANGTKDVLDALDVDGEPAYELLLAPGLLWLATLLLDARPRGERKGFASPAAQCATLPLWRGRCAFAWQLSLAEASERGLGQSPWLFELAVHDVIGTTGSDGPLAGPGLLTADALDAVRATTLPVVQVSKRGRPGTAAGAVSVLGVAGHGGKADTADDAKAPVAEPAKGPISSAPPTVRAALLTEFAVRLCWYGRAKPFQDVSEAACEVLGISYQVTGVLGIKRKYQTEEFAQLVVRVSRGGEGPSPTVEQSSVKEGEKAEKGSETKAPGNLSLLEVDDLNDVLEAPKLSASVEEQDRQRLERPLSSVEQTILLARCHFLWATSNPNDEMVLEEVNALAQRVIKAEETALDGDAADGPLYTANWLSFSCGLWYRCRAEHHRNKTRERAAFQLQSLVDQFADERPTAAHRLLMVHGVGYPARFHLQREMGMRMMRMGMVSTAHEQFKKLKMWPEAVDCLMIADRNVEAIDMVKELLEQAPTPRLWCCLGDLEKDHTHYEKAWELSKQRFARAQRSLGRHWFMKGDLAKAVDHFRRGLEINPLHGSVWFTMGCAQLKLERYSDAVQTFSRCVGIEDEHSEAWANLAAAHQALGNPKEARSCIYEATKRARENWKMWESFLGISMQLRDFQGVIMAMRRLAELDQAVRINQRIMGMMTAAVINDMDKLYDSRTGRAFLPQMTELFKDLTSRNTSVPYYWRFYADLQEAQGRLADALDSRLKQSRSQQARLWEEADPERFTERLEDLFECFQAIEEALSSTELAGEARQLTQSFAYSVQNTAQRLQAKLDSGVRQPSWQETLVSVKSLAARVEARAAALDGSSGGA